MHGALSLDRDAFRDVCRQRRRGARRSGVQIVGDWWMEGGMGVVDINETGVVYVGEAALPGRVLSEERRRAVSNEDDQVLIVGAPEIGRTNQGIRLNKVPWRRRIIILRPKD